MNTNIIGFFDQTHKYAYSLQVYCSRGMTPFYISLTRELNAPALKDLRQHCGMMSLNQYLQELFFYT